MSQRKHCMVVHRPESHTISLEGRLGLHQAFTGPTVWHGDLIEAAQNVYMSFFGNYFVSQSSTLLYWSHLHI